MQQIFVTNDIHIELLTRNILHIVLCKNDSIPRVSMFL